MSDVKRNLEALKLRTSVLEPPRIDPQYLVSETDAYIRRHIGNTECQTQEMLKQVNVSTIDQLMNETVPESIRLGQGQMFRHNSQQINGLDSNYQVLSHMRNLAALNKVNTDYYGQGYYPSILPVVILRNVLENPKWYTPYTPY